MVTAVRQELQSEDVLGVTATAVEPNRQTSFRDICGRCGTRLVMGYDEPECIACGWSDYSHTNETSRSKSVISAATRYILRYVGDFPALAHTLAHVHLVRVRNRAIFAVACPFCKKEMEQSSLSGKRPDLREQRYKCVDGHRVSLVPLKGDLLGWR